MIIKALCTDSQARGCGGGSLGLKERTLANRDSRGEMAGLGSDASYFHFSSFVIFSGAKCVQKRPGTVQLKKVSRAITKNFESSRLGGEGFTPSS